MKKRVVFPVTLVIAACACAGSACGNTFVGPSAGADSGSGEDAASAAEGGAAASSSSGGSGAGSGGSSSGGMTLPDGGAAVAPNGRLLVPSPSASVRIDGLTTDDFVVYTDTSAVPEMVYAISLASGSKPVTLGPLDPDNDVVVAGRVVFFESGENSSGVGKLSAWTSTLTASTVLSTASCSGNVGSGQYATSADGKYVLFFDDANTTCSTGTLTVAAVDGSSKTALIPSVDLAGNYCSLMLAFGGDTGVAAYCVTGGDGGVVIDASLPEGGSTIDVATVSSFTGPGWAPQHLVVGAQTGIAVDPAGTKVVVVGSDGTTAYPIAGGPPVPIDPNGQLGNVTGAPGTLIDDGGALVYTTGALALDRAATTSPANPVPLTDGGAFSDILYASPDQAWVIGTSNTSYYPDSDLYLVSTTGSGGVATLSSAIDARVSGDAFTADSSRALFLSAVTKQGSGTLKAVPVAGGAPTAIATNVVVAHATSGTKIVIGGDFDPNEGVVDLLVADAAKGTPATVLVSLADRPSYMNATKTTVIYSWSYEPGASSGIWALTVP